MPTPPRHCASSVGRQSWALKPCAPIPGAGSAGPRNISIESEQERRRRVRQQSVKSAAVRENTTMNKVTKAIFPVAGLGTRFLPATKASPKEMMPVVDKPLIQFAVEEAVAAGVTEMIFVTGRSKRAIEDHFDKSYEIEAELEARGKQKLLDLVRSIK